MKWIGSLSTKVSLEAAIREIREQVIAGMGDRALDAGFLFASSTFASEFPRLLPLLIEQLPVRHLIGCAGSGIIGGDREFEEKPAISLLVGHIPEASIRLLQLSSEELPDLDSSPSRWEETLGVRAADRPNFVLVADPFSFPIDDMLQGLDFAYPEAVKVGGLASGGGASGNALFYVREGACHLVREGLVGMALWGGVTIEAIVAQGCRPIGEIVHVSRCDRHIILSLNDRPALDVVRDAICNLSDRDRDLAEHSLFVGLIANEFKAEPEPGDFLIRNIIGVDPRSGALAVGDRVRAGQRLQLHLRDAATSAEDIEAALRHYSQAHPAPPEAALMFSCVGRGERLYGQPNFDSRLACQYLGRVPMAGFFCNGEIGPVGGTTYLHGYTSSFGLIRPR